MARQQPQRSKLAAVAIQCRILTSPRTRTHHHREISLRHRGTPGAHPV